MLIKIKEWVELVTSAEHTHHLLLGFGDDGDDKGRNKNHTSLTLGQHQW